MHVIRTPKLQRAVQAMQVLSSKDEGVIKPFVSLCTIRMILKIFNSIQYALNK